VAGCAEYEFLLEDGDKSLYRLEFGLDEGVFNQPIENRVLSNGPVGRFLYLLQFPLVIVRFAESIEAGTVDDQFRRNRRLEEFANKETSRVQERRLLSLLESQDPVLRRRGLGLLESEGLEKHRDKVVQALVDPDPNVRWTAIQIFRFHPHRDAIPALIQMLASGISFEREAALETLARIEDPAAVEGVLRLLQTSDPSLRIRVLESLGRKTLGHDERVLPLLLDELSSSDPAVRETAIRSLQERTDKEFGYDALAEPVLRDRAVRRWIEWWEKTRKADEEEQAD
jgi:hypothetical protein